MFLPGLFLDAVPQKKSLAAPLSPCGVSGRKLTDLSLPTGQSPRWSGRDSQILSAGLWPFPGLPEGSCHRISTREAGGLEERENLSQE